MKQSGWDEMREIEADLYFAVVVHPLWIKLLPNLIKSRDSFSFIIYVVVFIATLFSLKNQCQCKEL